MERAVSILEVLAEEQSGLGIVELSERVTLPVSSVHRVLATLGESSFVSQNVATGHYRIGFRAFEIGNAFLQQSQVRDVAQPHIQELAVLTRETVNLALRDGAFATYVDQVQSPRPFQVVPKPGGKVPLYCSGVGKVFLAGMSPSEFESIFCNMELTPWTYRTITDFTTLRENIDGVRRQGYSIDDEEMQLGMRCFAAPIYDYRNVVTAAISLIGPVADMSDEHLPELVTQLCRAASIISEQLGYRPEGH